MPNTTHPPKLTAPKAASRRGLPPTAASPTAPKTTKTSKAPKAPSAPTAPTAPTAATAPTAPSRSAASPKAGRARSASLAQPATRAAKLLPADPAEARRGELFAAECPSRNVFRHVTSLWGVLSLIALQDGTQRFSALRRRVRGVSEKMLAQTLQLLEQDGLVKRVAHPVVPPHVDYSLTLLGQQVATRVADLADCIETNLGQVMQHQQARQVRPGRPQSLPDPLPPGLSHPLVSARTSPRGQGA